MNSVITTQILDEDEYFLSHGPILMLTYVDQLFEKKDYFRVMDILLLMRDLFPFDRELRKYVNGQEYISKAYQGMTDTVNDYPLDKMYTLMSELSSSRFKGTDIYWLGVHRALKTNDNTIIWAMCTHVANKCRDNVNFSKKVLKIRSKYYGKKTAISRESTHFFFHGNHGLTSATLSLTNKYLVINEHEGHCNLSLRISKKIISGFQKEFVAQKKGFETVDIIDTYKIETTLGYTLYSHSYGTWIRGKDKTTQEELKSLLKFMNIHTTTNDLSVDLSWLAHELNETQRTMISKLAECPPYLFPLLASEFSCIQTFFDKLGIKSTFSTLDMNEFSESSKGLLLKLRSTLLISDDQLTG